MHLPNAPALAVLLVPTLSACLARAVTVAPIAQEAREAALSTDVLDVLSFNVAGLPSCVAKVDGRETHPLIGQAVADFDLVLLQEDFWYHELIEAPQPWQVRPRRGELFRLGDGLARFAWMPLGEVEHVPWRTAHGWFNAYHDKLAWKGFSVGSLSVGEGASIRVYNVHFDAGGAKGDRDAREAQREQLIADILERWSADEALIVAGDFNTGRGGLDDLRVRTGLEDSGVGGIDRILFRSGARVALRPSPDSTRPEPDLERLRGLSDHRAVWARFGVTCSLGASPASGSELAP